MPFPYSNDDPENDAWTLRDTARGWLACIGAAAILALIGWGIAHHVMATNYTAHLVRDLQHEMRQESYTDADGNFHSFGAGYIKIHWAEETEEDWGYGTGRSP